MVATGSAAHEELVFLPLGGIGEIGMNVYLYGWGATPNRQWLMVDLGVTFPTDAEPGVDVVFPDLRFIEDERQNLAGILLTHAHEDHFGAVAEMWPRLRVPVYCTKFAAALLKGKLQEYSHRDEVPIVEVAQGSRFNIGSFDVELATVAHSIPECNAVLIRTPLGNILHTGDWKIDAVPGLNGATDTAKLQAFGHEGVHVLVCDSTNALVEGVSVTEGAVAAGLREVVASAKGRVAVTTFASNVQRLVAIGEAAKAAERELVLVGRAMHRIAEAARDTGLWPEHLTYMDQEYFNTVPGDHVLALVTGSQGEVRAALARIAEGDHPFVKLSRGDTVIYSARTIPGNEEGVIRLQNRLADQGVHVVTEDPRGPIHASGHPRRGELAQLYRWLRPKYIIPMHGEPRHLEEHALFARERGLVPVLGIRDGKMVRLLPGAPEVIDTAPVGRIYRDGTLLLSPDDDSIRERRKLAWVGMIAVSVVLTRQGEIVGEPQVAAQGIPLEDQNGIDLEERALNAVEGALESIPRQRRRNPDLVREAVERSVRAEMKSAWGKKPVCVALVTVVR
jgi:ribonuclease J